MRKYFWNYFLCLLTLFSCSSKDKVPKSLIQPDKMEDVLWDVMRMQFLAERKAATDTTVNKEAELNDLTDKVFNIHQVTEKKFNSSYNWYVNHPSVLKRIFDSMQVRKQRAFNEAEDQNDMEEKLDSVPENPPAKNRRLLRKKKDMMEEIQ